MLVLHSSSILISSSRLLLSASSIVFRRSPSNNLISKSFRKPSLLHPVYKRHYYCLSTTDYGGMGIQLKFSNGLERSDPKDFPVTIIGQIEHLKALPFSKIQCKLEPRVTEETFKSAVESLHPSPTDSCSLYLNAASIIALPKSVSLDNTPSRAHSVTKVVKSSVALVNEYLVVLVEQPNLFATACAIARAFPLYNRKTNGSRDEEKSTITVEFLIVSKSKSGEFIVGADNDTIDVSTMDLLQSSEFAIRNTARLIDTPCSEMHTDQFVKEAELIAQELGIEPLIIRGKELEAKGFGGLWNVGKAAEHLPALVVLSHKPASATKTIAWVGKGIVYDTGGLSIKSKTAMPSMKVDCGGAAGVLNAFYVAVKNGFKENLHAVLCLAENSVGPLATRPDDVITLYSGKTVEVNNTDAEGRLVLGDGVAYAKQDLGADIILDMATLTGAQGIATGKHHAAVLTNCSSWRQYTQKAGRRSGDLTFPIVFAPEFHFSEFNSPVADMKNSAADRSNALSSCAGLFIMKHIGFDFPGIYVHVDMASPVTTNDRANGYGVALLNALFGHYSSNETLQKLSPINKAELELSYTPQNDD